MSYCRFGENSNVYLCKDILGCWICYSCRLAPEVMEGIPFHRSIALVSLEEVKAHLEAHQEAGHLVPDYDFERVERELAKEMKLEPIRYERKRKMRQSILKGKSDHAIQTGIMNGEPLNDLQLVDMQGPYCRSKFLAEKEAFSAAKNGQPVVVVSPTMPIGPGDWNLTLPTKMILMRVIAKNDL